MDTSETRLPGASRVKLTFFWSYDFGEEHRLYPHCKPDEGDSNLLCMQLEDDGGVGIETFSLWIKEAITRIDAVSRGAKPKEIWGGEALCTDITADGADVYFLGEEDKFEHYELSAFRRALVAWLEFIQSEPGVNTTVEVEI